jgi:nucleoside-diphosphate-sugar epimerase
VEHHERISFVDDMAQAVVFALENELPDLYNVGTGEDLTIKQLANHPKNNGHQGEIIWDAQNRWYPRKLMDISKCMHWDGNTKCNWKKEYKNLQLVLKILTDKQVKM